MNMKNIYYVILLIPLLVGCSLEERKDPYDLTRNTLDVTLAYPEGFDSLCREGVTVSIESADKDGSYTVLTDSAGHVSIELVNGIYRITVSDRTDGGMFNGRADRINLVDKDQNVTIDLLRSLSGDIVFKEIYNGGCSAYPLEGTYQSDKYVILHNQ